MAQQVHAQKAGETCVNVCCGAAPLVGLQQPRGGNIILAATVRGAVACSIILAATARGAVACLWAVAVLQGAVAV